MPNPLLSLLEHELEALAEALVPKVIARLEARGVIPASVVPVVNSVVEAVEATETASTSSNPPASVPAAPAPSVAPPSAS